MLVAPGGGRGIEIDNRSPYRTSDIAAFVRAALRTWGGPKTLLVTVTTHPKMTRGCAPLGGRSLGLALGPGAERARGNVALILRHELAHLRGVDHDEMPEALLYSEGTAPAWAKRLPLRRKSIP